MSVRDIYENLKAAIGRAEAEKQYDIPIVLAESLGFVKRETPQPVLAFEYMYCADDGSIRFVYRSWDPSGPFQNLPDINRYFLSLYEPVDRFTLDYPD